jgi:hypothetical protein
MDVSLFLAKVIGLSLLITCVGVLVNLQFYLSLVKEIVKNPLILLIVGELDIVIGLLIIVSHNIWAVDWRLLITLIGWLLIVRGIIRIVFPQQISNLAINFSESSKFRYVVSFIITLFVLIGAFLTYKGFTV